MPRDAKQPLRNLTRYMKVGIERALPDMTAAELNELLSPARNAFILQGNNLYFVSDTKCIYPLLKDGKSFNPQIAPEKVDDIFKQIAKQDAASFKHMIIKDNPASEFDLVDDPRAREKIIEQGKEKLTVSQMTALKTELKMVEEHPIPTGETFTFNSKNWEQLGLASYTGLVSGQKNPKGIPVTVIKKEGQVLVQVGPCDLSGVGGHEKREAIIKALVNKALENSGEKLKYEDVHVSASSGVRGRLQMFLDKLNPFSNATTQMSNSATHMNAYIKTAGEAKATHWEPRKGPQSFFNDTICALVTSIATNHFEHQVLKTHEKNYTSEQATKDILKNKDFKSIFDNLLQRSSTTVKEMVNMVKDFKKNLQGVKETAEITPAASIIPKSNEAHAIEAAEAEAKAVEDALDDLADGPGW